MPKPERLTHCPENGRSLEGIDPRKHAANLCATITDRRSPAAARAWARGFQAPRSKSAWTFDLASWACAVAHPYSDIAPHSSVAPPGPPPGCLTLPQPCTREVKALRAADEAGRARPLRGAQERGLDFAPGCGVETSPAAGFAAPRGATPCPHHATPTHPQSTAPTGWEC